MSLSHSLCLRQFCPPLFGFLRFVRGFVEFDQVIDGLLGVWMRFSELQIVAFDYFTTDLWELWE